MGTDDRSPAGPLIDQFNREPYRFDFFQAARLAELLRPDMMPAGHGGSNLEAVARDYRVSRAAVRAAWAYYEDHKQAIDARLAADSAP